MIAAAAYKKNSTVVKESSEIFRELLANENAKKPHSNSVKRNLSMELDSSVPVESFEEEQKESKSSKKKKKKKSRHAKDDGHKHKKRKIKSRSDDETSLKEN